MTLNEALVRQNFLKEVVLKDNENELPKELKVKVMQMRIKLNKLRNQFDEDSQTVIQELKPEGFDALYSKPDKTEEEEQQLLEWTNKLTEEHTMFVNEKGKEEIEFDFNFTEDDFAEIVNVNTNDVNINGTPLSAEDFLEVIYTLFVD